jgi:hypothetical protein
MKPPPSLLVLGDSRQSIYQFKDADPRFLTMADWGLYNLAAEAQGEREAEAEAGGSAAQTMTTKRTETTKTMPRAEAAGGVLPETPWRHHTLRTSFRATPNIASFVNHAMLGFKCIHANPRPELYTPKGAPVTYLVGSTFTVAARELVDEIEYLLDDGYTPDDIFILTPSLKGAKLNAKTPLAQLENTLVMRLNIPVYVSNSDEAGRGGGAQPRGTAGSTCLCFETS